MLTLFILACHVMDPTDCFTAEDVKGPHETHAACKVRAEEMRDDLYMLTRGMYEAKKWRCLTGQEIEDILKEEVST